MNAAKERDGRGTREGVALPLLLFLLLSMTLLAHGVLLLARMEQQASHAFLHATRSDLVARSALDAGLAGLGSVIGGSPADTSVLLLEEWLQDGLGRKAMVRWLTRELFLLEGQGRSRGWPGERRVGAAGWRLDPVTRLKSFRGGVEAKEEISTSGSGVISSEGFLDTPEGWEESDCESYAGVLDSLYSSGPVPATAPLSGNAGEGEGDGTELPGLGLLWGSRLLDLGGTGSSEEPVPPGGMGGEGCPGSGDSLFQVQGGGLELGEGRWCGLLVVEEDLTLRGDGLFQGLLLVGGTLNVEGGWRIQGMARVGGAVHISGLARLEISACPVMRVLEETPILRKPFLLPTGSRPALF